MSLHADASAELRGWDPEDPRQRQLRASFLDLLDRRSDALDRRCAPAHITASALVQEPHGRILLVFHRKIRRWIQPGGHAEASDHTLRGAALREAIEESGIPDLRVEPGILQVDRHPAPCRPGVVDEHFDVRYRVFAPAGATPAVSPESLEVRWFDPSELPDGIEPTILEMVALAAARGAPQRL